MATQGRCVACKIIFHWSSPWPLVTTECPICRGDLRPVRSFDSDFQHLNVSVTKVMG